MAMGAGAFKVGTLSACLSLSLLLLAGIASQAQTPPSAAPIPPSSPQPRPIPGPMPGFVSPFEIIRTVRSAGFDHLSPPLREGTIYVLRATDYRGIPMRVVLDARTGMIRNATPLVTSAAYGMAPPPYASRPYAVAPYAAPYGPPYRSPTGYDGAAPSGQPPQEAAAPPPQSAAMPPISRAATAAPPLATPLPRPRPAVLASKTPDSAANSGQASKSSGQGASGTAQAPVGDNANQTNAGSNGGARPPSAVPSKQFPL
jgi:hypothetical protein